MPSVSKNQNIAANIAEAVQAGKAPATPGMPSTEMADSMKPADLNEFASTPQAGLPKRKLPPAKRVGKAVQKARIPKKRGK